MASLVDALKQLSIILGSVDGVARAFTEAPEGLDEFPSFVIYTSAGTQTLFPEEDTPMGKATRKHTTKAILYIAFSEKYDFAEIENRARPFIEKVYDKLLENLTLNGTVETLLSPISYSFGTSRLAGYEYWTIMFDISYRVRPSVTTRS